MFIAIIVVCVHYNSRYFVPPSESIYGGMKEQRIVVASTKRELYTKLRNYEMSPVQIFRVIREIPLNGMDAVVREWDDHYESTFWEIDTSQ